MVIIQRGNSYTLGFDKLFYTIDSFSENSGYSSLRSPRISAKTAYCALLEASFLYNSCHDTVCSWGENRVHLFWLITGLGIYTKVT